MPAVTRNAIWLLALAAALAMLTNKLSPAGIPLFGQWDETQGLVRANPRELHTAAAIAIKDIHTAKLIYDQGGTVFVDARPLDAYREGHVSGALPLPAWDADESIDEFLNSYPPDQPIVIYCSGRTCDDSHRLAAQLGDLGYIDVSIMIDGFPEWEARGYPVVR